MLQPNNEKRFFLFNLYPIKDVEYFLIKLMMLHRGIPFCDMLGGCFLHFSERTGKISIVEY